MLRVVCCLRQVLLYVGCCELIVVCCVVVGWFVPCVVGFCCVCFSICYSLVVLCCVLFVGCWHVGCVLFFVVRFWLFIVGRR